MRRAGLPLPSCPPGYVLCVHHHINDLAMSDAAAEPGAPTNGATNIPPASEKSIAAEVKDKVPERAITLASTPDKILLRLNK